MKKFAICFLTVCLIIGLVGCDAETLGKVGQVTKKTGNNVFGLKPSMAAVNGATTKLESSISEDEHGNISIDFSDAAQVVADIQSIKTSPQKTEELQKQLSEPATTEENADKVKAALETELQTQLNNVEALGSSVPEEFQGAVEAVNSTLGAIKDNLADNPTKGELLTVAIIADLSDTVSDLATSGIDLETEEGKSQLLEAVSKASDAIETIKITSDVANIDVIGSTISALLASMGASEGSKALIPEELGNEDALDVVLKNLIETYLQAIGFDAETGTVNAVAYKKALFDFAALKAAYEIKAWAVARFGATPVLTAADIQNSDYSALNYIYEIAKIPATKAFNYGDFVSYIVSAAFTEFDALCNDAYANAATINAEIAEFNQIPGTWKEKYGVDADTAIPEIPGGGAVIIGKLVGGDFLEAAGWAVTSVFDVYENQIVPDCESIAILANRCVKPATTAIVIAFDSGLGEAVEKFSGQTIEDLITAFISDISASNAE